MRENLFTIIGHRHLPFMNPMGEERVREIIELVRLPAGGNIADFGAGTCELPIRLVERYGVHAECVELSPTLASLARDRAADRLRAVAQGGVTVHEGDAGAFKATIPPASFDLTICIGSTHALGGLAMAVRTMARLTRPGGLVLIGEGIWERPPTAQYLLATGIGTDDFRTLAENLDVMAGEGLMPRWIATTSVQEWDAYEWAHARSIEDWAATRPGDETAKGLVTRSRAWRDAYVRAGRNTLGFGLYLMRVPGGAAPTL